VRSQGAQLGLSGTATVTVGRQACGGL